MTCEEDDEIVAFNSGRQGDDWHQTSTRTTGDREYDSDSLLVQIRAADGTLIASSGDDGAGVIQIDVTDTDFGGDPIVFAWKTTDDTTDVDPDGSYVIEAECEIDGFLTTFYSHEWVVLAEHAYAEGGS